MDPTTWYNLSYPQKMDKMGKEKCIFFFSFYERHTQLTTLAFHFKYIKYKKKLQEKMLINLFENLDSKIIDVKEIVQ